MLLADLAALESRLSAATQADGITVDRELLTEMIRRSRQYESLVEVVRWAKEQLARGRTSGAKRPNLLSIEDQLSAALSESAGARNEPTERDAMPMR